MVVSPKNKGGSSISLELNIVREGDEIAIKERNTIPEGEEITPELHLHITGFGEDEPIVEAWNAGDSGQKVGHEGPTLGNDADVKVKMTQE